MEPSFGAMAVYFEAVASLDISHDANKLKALAHLLGLLQPQAEQPPMQPPPRVIVEPLPPPREEEASSSPSERPAARGPEPTARPRRREPLRFTLTPTRVAKRVRPEWFGRVTMLEPPPDTPDKPLPPTPLLAQRWSRAILSTAMSRPRETNDIDMDAILEAAGRGRPIPRVPRRVIPSLAGGVQVLVDRGPAAEPFLPDQESLVEQILAVAGRDAQVVRFDPTRGFVAGTGPRHRWTSYFDKYRPLPGVAIVLLTDLGITTVPLESAATTGEWLDFVTRLREGGNFVTAFVPYAEARWPPAIRRLIPIVRWDRGVNVQTVRRALSARLGLRRWPA